MNTNIDGVRRRELAQADIEFFRRNGYLVVRNLLCEEERAALSAQTGELIEHFHARSGDPDYYFRPVQTGEEPTPFRVEYVLDKVPTCRTLLAHPLLLRAIEQLQGPEFIPTWDSLVFKLPGAGVPHPWHRDGAPYEENEPGIERDVAAIDVGIYLDGSEPSNCLWVMPGSNKWPDKEADRLMEDLGTSGFDSRTAVPVPVQPGDAILHNIFLIHGSPSSRSSLRRVVYLEFRQLAAEERAGPHTAEYIPLKQQMLLDCIAQRRRAPYAHGEKAFAYAAANVGGARRAGCYRFAHEDYWRYAKPFQA